jgi:hypothetical protein
VSDLPAPAPVTGASYTGAASTIDFSVPVDTLHTGNSSIGRVAIRYRMRPSPILSVIAIGALMPELGLNAAAAPAA